MFGKIGSTLRTANEALAEAQKSWRDGDLADREQRLAEREAALVLREADFKQRSDAFRKAQTKDWLMKLAFAALATVAVIAAFLIGSSTAQSPIATAADTTEAPAFTADQDSPSAVADSASSERSLPPRQPDAASFRECVAKGDAYFKEIGAWPNLTSTGENAHSTAIERCGRTIGAFDGG